MIDKNKKSLANQLPTFISECLLLALCLTFVGLMVYNYIPGRNYFTNQIHFNIEGNITNFVILVVSCSVAMAAGLALVIVSIVGKYRDKIMLPHHISFISGVVSMTAGLVLISLLLFAGF